MNINDLKNRIQNLNRRTNKQNDIWKPKGEHVVRLLPYPHGNDPFIELWFHYEIGETTILCPSKNFGNDCAVCDFCEVLKAWKDTNGVDKPESERKADFEIFKKIQAKCRVYVPMVEREKEAEGAKFWGITPNQALEILELCSDGERLESLGLAAGDESNGVQVVTSPEKAYDLKVSFRKAGEKGNDKKFGVTNIEGKLKPSALSADKKVAADLIASIKNIKDVYPEISSAEVSKLMKKFVGSAAPEAKPEGGSEKYPANTKENAKTQVGRSIDEAFSDMLDEKAE